MKTYRNQSPGKKSALPALLGLVALVGVGVSIAWLKSSPASAPKPAVAVAAAPKPKPPVAVAPPVADDPPAFAGDFDPNDPQFQAAMKQRMQQMVDNFYGDLFDQMDLSPQQQSQVNDLMLQRAQDIGTSFQNAFQQGNFDPNAGPEQFRQIADQAAAKANSQLQAVLGDDNYQQFHQRDEEVRQTFENGGGFGGDGVGR